MVRRVRARERGYLASLLHDGPIQELAAVALEHPRRQGFRSGSNLGCCVNGLDKNRALALAVATAALAGVSAPMAHAASGPSGSTTTAC
jgi:hypothetical protein